MSAVPAAGHLSSSSMYPTCQAPYVLLTACSDERIRFWSCDIKTDNSKLLFEWSNWAMVSGTIESDLEMDGEFQIYFYYSIFISAFL